MLGQGRQVVVARLEHGGAHRDLAAQRFLLVHAIAGAAGGIQGQLWCPQRGEALAGEVDMSLVERHDLGEQLLGRTEDARHTHSDEGVVAHEAGELQVLRMRRDQRQQFTQRGLVGHPAAMQADVQFDVDAHPGPQPLGQRQVLTQALRRIDQPLQLPRRVERALVLAVEQFRRTHRQRLAEEDVGIRKSDCVVVEERLVEGHQPPGAGAPGDVRQQAGRGQRLLHQPQMLAAAADRTHHHIDVVVQAIEVDEQHRAHRAIGLEFAVQRAEIVVVRPATVGGTHPGGSSRQQRAGPEAGEHELASIHGVAPFRSRPGWKRGAH